MRTVERIEADIERVSEERRNAYGRDADLVARLSADLDGLYAERRRAKARAEHGPAEDIAKSARVERELEKLMS